MATLHSVYCQSNTEFIYSYVLEMIIENVVPIPSIHSIIPICLFTSGQNGSQIDDPFKLCENNVIIQSTK
jgi:hypothetical protein